MYVCVHVCVAACVRVFMPLCLRVHVCMCVCVRVRVCAKYIWIKYVGLIGGCMQLTASKQKPEGILDHMHHYHKIV